MTEVQMQVRRALWTTQVKAAIRGTSYQWTITVESDRTIFMFWHPESKDWKSKFEIIQRSAVLVLRLNDKPLSGPGPKRLVLALDADRDLYDQTVKVHTSDEAQAKSWLERQEKELAGLKDIPWLALTIITEGPYAGSYRVSLEPGNPLEHLTIGQVKEFSALCQRLNWKT